MMEYFKMLRILMISSLLVGIHCKLDEEKIAVMSLIYPKDWSCPFSSEEVEGDPGERLLLTPYIENEQFKLAKNLSKVSPGLFPNDAESFSGFITMDKEKNSNLFFWYFPHEDPTAPLILWLEGGPGFPFMYSIFRWLGPYQINDSEDSFIENPHTWHNNNSVLYIDNPIGTGFSFTDSEDGYSTTTIQSAEMIYEFLLQFFQVFPEALQAPFYVCGQSYGGKFAPATAYLIHKRNPTADLKINLQGISLWSSFIDPIASLDLGDILYHLGFITDEVATDIKKLYLNIKAKDANGTAEKYDAIKTFFEINNLFSQNAGGIQMHNFEKHLADMLSLLSYPMKTDVRRALHVGNTTYNDLSSMYSYAELVGDFMSRNALPWLEELLDHYRVMMLSGQLDLRTPYTPNIKVLHNLKWSGAEDFKNAKRFLWLENDDVAGYVRHARNFTEILLRNTGHFIIGEEPRRAEILITSFTHNISIFDCPECNV